MGTTESIKDSVKTGITIDPINVVLGLVLVIFSLLILRWVYGFITWWWQEQVERSAKIQQILKAAEEQEKVEQEEEQKRHKKSVAKKYR